MKKLLLTFAAACMAFTLTGCNNTTPTEDCIITNVGTTTFHPIMKTENGYYYNSVQFGDMALRYYDNATGHAIYLCAKPECTHNGDKFCTATSEGFFVLYTQLYDNNIYIAAAELDGKRTYLKLLKASLDGTQLTEVCTVVQTTGNEKSLQISQGSSSTMILHRGYALIPYFLRYNSPEIYGKAGLAIVNLSDGSVQYLPEYEQSETTCYRDVTPYGDYIYYTLNNSKELHRYHLKTGEDEILPLRENLKETYGTSFSQHLKTLETYTVIDNKVWYVCGDDIAFKPSMFIYDPDANTTTLVEAFEGKFMTKVKEYDKNGELYATYTNYYVSAEPMYDGTYLYLAEKGFYSSEFYDHDMKVHIFTLEGERLGGFVFERKGPCQMNLSGETITVPTTPCQINIVDETFYIQTVEGTVYCSVADVISGNIEWKELYQFGKGES